MNVPHRRNRHRISRSDRRLVLPLADEDTFRGQAFAEQQLKVDRLIAKIDRLETENARLKNTIKELVGK